MEKTIMFIGKLISRSLTSAAILSCAVLGAACVGAPAESGEDTAAAPAAETEFLYGLQREDLVKLYPLVQDREKDVEAWIAANRAPFDCGRYGDMCRAVGQQAAYTITEKSYRMGLDGASRDEINAFLKDALRDGAKALQAKGDREDDTRDSNTCTFTGGANNERLKADVWAMKPLIGDWNTQADCVYQIKSLGLWFPGSGATVTSCDKGHLLDFGTIIQQSPPSGEYCATGSGGEIDALEIYYYPPNTTDTIHSHVDCTAVKGGFSASGSCIVNN
jgi:hypothetical protein